MPRRLARLPHFFERAAPNALVQVDLVEEEPTAIGTVHGVFYIDDYSRFCLGGAFFFDKGEDNVLQVGRDVVTAYGLPQEILSDNGSQFRPALPAARASGAKTRYQLGWEILGVTVTFAAPAHPQTKGKEERFNRFMKEDFLNEVRAQVTSLADLNARFEEWRSWYNTAHTHRGVDGQPPAQRYRPGLRVAQETVWRAFAREERRTVRLDGTIQVDNRTYRLPNGWERSRVRIARLGCTLKVYGGKDNLLLGEWSVMTSAHNILPKVVGI